MSEPLEIINCGRYERVIARPNELIRTDACMHIFFFVFCACTNSIQVIAYSILLVYKDLNKKIVFVTVIVSVALIISVIFNLHYSVNLRRENENVLRTIRSRHYEPMAQR